MLPSLFYAQAIKYQFNCECDKELTLAYNNVDKELLDDNLKKIPSSIEQVSATVDKSMETIQKEIAMVQKSNAILMLEVIELQNILDTIKKTKEIETIKSE